ncbi:MAG: hypothetical protein LBT29_09365 [Flavobacteriaceae bacterium]|jgi:glutathione synthase/RimK-type ligase-like ATP-grasp enzyme|nr:hypothetical protein [Flavobacteriaceae bacterium]
MILILTEKYDPSSQNVISKLESKNANYKVIYGLDLLEKPFNIDINKQQIFFKNELLENINIVWYRRWLNYQYVFSENLKENDYLKTEFETLSSYLMLTIQTKKWLNIPPFINPYPSKAHQLKKAKECGLKIPNTNVTNKKNFLKKFYNENKDNIISKNLNNPYVLHENNEIHCTYTTKIEKKDIKNQENLFFPSIFQSNINKDVELRIFYFLRKFYSSAIFSSHNQQTNVDFRVYDYNRPNRIMKFELPEFIKLKLIDFMESFNLHTGSIDIMKDKGDNFYFLEVNPQGQFGGMSDYGLNIENDIADYLIENDF